MKRWTFFGVPVRLARLDFTSGPGRPVRAFTSGGSDEQEE
jgi:hypothetical protein